MLLSQPVAEEPFRFETELDDLPKEKLKGTVGVDQMLATVISNIIRPQRA